jgi:hypothetical protein
MEAEAHFFMEGEPVFLGEPFGEEWRIDTEMPSADVVRRAETGAARCAPLWTIFFTDDLDGRRLFCEAVDEENRE